MRPSCGGREDKCGVMGHDRKRNDADLVQAHCCVMMMNWEGIELIAQH